MFNQDSVKNAANSLLTMFQSGHMPEAIAFTIIGKGSNSEQPSHHWSIGNQILMLLQGTEDARGFQQWKQVSRSVKKGSKSIYILAPMIRSIEDEGNSGKVQELLIGFRPIPVFRIEDTEGLPLTKHEFTPPAPPPFWDVAAYLGVDIEYAPALANYLGKYNRLTNKITLCAQDAFVHFHELAHAVHHTIVPLSGATIAKAEIVAELTAAVLCQLQSIRGYEAGCYEYIRHYCRDKDPVGVVKTVMGLLTEVEQVVEKILFVAQEIDRQKQEKQSS